MPLTTAGRNVFASAIIGGAYTSYNNAGAHIGVGNSTTAFSAAQTDLIGASKFRRPMEVTYPTQSVNVLTFRSLFGTAEANFAWDEWGIFNAVSAGDMLSRKVEALGTKTSAQSWQITVALTVTAA